MALIPKIDIVINSKCNKIDIYEETSPYVAATNAGGWGAPNIDTDAITAADLKIYDYTGVTLLNTIVLYDGVTDVYSGVAGAPAPGAFLAIDELAWANADGVYELVYSVTDGITPVTNAKQYSLIICGLLNCTDGLKASIIEECCSKKLKEEKNTLDQLEIFIYGIKSAFSCGDFATVADLIVSAKYICDNLCDCGCSNC